MTPHDKNHEENSEEIRTHASTTTSKDQEYWANQIKVLEWLEPVRMRPWMYIWSTDAKWLHHTVQEIVDNCVDEALAWHCDAITLTLHADHTVTVQDNWRGIPVDIHPKTWKSALETVFTVLHAWWKFEKSAYKISWWLHWVWASVVNALSTRLEVRVHKDGKVHYQKYYQWVPDWDLRIIWDTDITGTTVRYLPDDTVFETIELQENLELTRMKRGAYLTPWVTFTFVDERTKNKQRFMYEWWIKTWLTNLVGEQEQLSSVHYLSAEWKDCWLELSFQMVNSTNENIISFVNNITTPDGWTHVLWFKSALLTIINELAKEKWKLHKKIWEFQYSDVTDGIYAIITVKIPEPQFQWQTKWRLWNSYVRRVVEKMVYDYLSTYFTENEDEFDKMFEKIELAARARLAAKIAKETVIRKNVLAWGVLPWKLSDCRKRWKKGTELYIVEWDSAWWSAKQGRDSEFQAILPLRWKILNTEQAHIQRILANKEVKNLITAIGCGLRDNFDEKSLRYDKIIIMTDADVDGAHIRTLLMTFFFRYMKPLIENGNLYVACPPIYRVSQWKKSDYLYPPCEDPVADAIALWYNKDQKIDVQRYKGLWEMNPDQLRDTTMDPAHRKFMQITIWEAEWADKIFRILMWEDVSLRKHFILTNAKSVKDLDL